MSSKTKILVLKLKELVYTGIFVIMGIILIVLIILIISGRQKTKNHSVSADTYNPGIYTSSIVLASNPVDLEIVVDANQIKAINLISAEESVETMYPLLSSSLSDIAAQVIKNNSVENVTYSYDSRYTSIVLINAIKQALTKAIIAPTS